MSDVAVLEVGVGKQYGSINAAIAAADQMGGNADIKVDAGTYTNDGGYLWDGVNNVTIEGVGGMAKIVDPAYYAGGKAAIVTGGQGIVLKNLDISGVTVPDANGAAVRYDQGTLLMDNVHLHGNQNGILAGADATGSITIQNSEIDHNGTSAGNTHNIYVGDVGQFTLTNSYVHDANVGHEVKSRAENTTIVNNRILDNNGSSSYAVDLPNGGTATITGNIIEQGANNQNHTINAYGEEGNLHSGSSVDFSNNVVVNDDGQGRGPVWSNNGANITGAGNSVWNAADLGSGVAASSFTSLSARPTIDTSSKNADPTPPVVTTTTLPDQIPVAVTPPALTVGQKFVGKTTSLENTLFGTVEDRGSGVAAVEIFENTGGHSIDLGRATLEGTKWHFDIQNLVPATYTFYAVGFDRAGHTTALTQTGAAVTVIKPEVSSQTAGDVVVAPTSGCTLTSAAPGQTLSSSFVNTTFNGLNDTSMYGEQTGNTFLSGSGSHNIKAGGAAFILMGNGDNVVSLSGSQSTVVLGQGNNAITGDIVRASIATGDGNQTVNITGEQNVITLGSGTNNVLIGAISSQDQGNKVVISGGRNTVQMNSDNGCIELRGGDYNRVYSSGDGVKIDVQTGTNKVVAQGSNVTFTTQDGVNSIAASGNNDEFVLGLGRSTIWASGNNDKIHSGLGTQSIAFLGDHDLIDLTRGASTLTAQGSNASIVLAAAGISPTQIYGNVIAQGDTLDLRTSLAATEWDGSQASLKDFLLVSSDGTSSTIYTDSDGSGANRPAAIAVLHNVSGLSYDSLLGSTLLR